MSIAQEKQQLSEKIWSEMQRLGIATFPLPCKGRIPNFVGAEVAAEKLRQLQEWRKAKVIFVNPDSPQRKVRENALMDGKILVMASPRLKRGFILLDPAKVKNNEHFASTIKGAFKYGKTISADEMPKPDLIVEGSVAVDSRGHRLGKGHGYGDIEIDILKRKFGQVPIVTTVHDIQVVENVPFEEKDEKISIIATSTRVIRVTV
ncbi:MAG: 5-formyltetrahydrofolate cyclo-ligase [Candidatus Bathycorpusculaceae bacterium]